MDADPDGTVDHLAYESPYKQLAGILAARISRGDWKPGRPIPSETRLGEEYNLSRGAVRRAIAVLVERGLVVVAPQRGTYVRPRD